MNNAFNDCSFKDRNGSREQVAGRRKVNCQHVLQGIKIILDRYLDRLKLCGEEEFIKPLTGLGRDGRI